MGGPPLVALIGGELHEHPLDEALGVHQGSLQVRDLHVASPSGESQGAGGKQERAIWGTGGKGNKPENFTAKPAKIAKSC